MIFSSHEFGRARKYETNTNIPENFEEIPIIIDGENDGMFDPNDNSNKKVFAGGVSGGLFVNDDISDPESAWRMITGIPKNLAVSSITYDPNDKKTFYVEF